MYFSLILYVTIIKEINIKMEEIMDREILLKMDPNILVSMVNMKLRDFYSNLDSYCEDMDISKSIIEEKLENAGYKYHSDINQFK